MLNLSKLHNANLALVFIHDCTLLVLIRACPLVPAGAEDVQSERYFHAERRHARPDTAGAGHVPCVAAHVT